MHRPARALTSLGLALTLLACQVPGVAGPGKATPKPSGPGVVGKGGAPLGATVATLVGMDGATLIGLDAASLIGFDGASLVGADGASLVGPDGASLIGPDGASLVGADGASFTGTVKAPAGLVAAGAGNLVAAGAGNLVAGGGGKAVSDMGGMYRLHAVAQAPLAHVHVYLRTASGKFVVDKAGKPIFALTDANGAFAFKGWRPARGLTVFVPAAKVDGDVQGLAALRPRDLGAGPVAIDAASTMVTSWVYDRVLAGQAKKADSLDRLPAALGEATTAAVAASLREEAVPKLGRKAYADALEALRAADAAIGQKLEEVRRVMTLAGTDNTLAAGARAITLQQPVDLALAPDGALYVVEAFGGIVRRIGPDGQATIVVGQGNALNESTVGALFPSDIALGPDGKLYLNSKYAPKVFRCNPDGSGFEEFAGGGAAAPGPGVKARDAKLKQIHAMAFDAEGGLVLGERNDDANGHEGRVLRVAPDGTIAELPAPWVGEAPLPNGARREIAALAIAPDGAMWLAEFEGATLWFKPRDGAWQVARAQLPVGRFADLLPQADGSVLLSLGVRFAGGEHTIKRFFRPGGAAPAAFAGTGEMGADPADVPTALAKLADPAGLAAGRDGAVLVADQLAGTVRALGADGVARILAGRTTGADVAALSEPLNVPGGIAIDAKGKVIVSEFGGHAIRRIDGDRSIRIAGGEPGAVPDGALATRLYAPASLAFQGEDMIVVEQGGCTVRRIRPDGTTVRLVGGGATELGADILTTRPDALAVSLQEPLAVAVSPDGLIHFNDRERIWRLMPDGRLDLVAGFRDLLTGEDPGEREGKNVRDIAFGRSAGMTFDPAGNLFVAEVNTSQIVKIDPAGTFTVYAGAGSAATFAMLIGMQIGTEGEVAARDAAFVVPTGLAFDAAGNLYVTEMGTRGVQSVASSFFATGATLPLLDGRIRKITPDGRVTTIAGLGGPAGTTGLRNPIGLVVDPEGHVIFVDNGTNQLKRL